jgi:hypothetical protein
VDIFNRDIMLYYNRWIKTIKVILDHIIDDLTEMLNAGICAIVFAII